MHSNSSRVRNVSQAFSGFRLYTMDSIFCIPLPDPLYSRSESTYVTREALSPPILFSIVVVSTLGLFPSMTQEPPGNKNCILHLHLHSLSRVAGNRG